MPQLVNQKGFSHIFLPLLVVLVVAVGGTYMLVSSHAATPGKPLKPHRFTPAQRQKFALAAANYWDNPQRIDQGRDAKARIYDVNSPEVSCKPGNVKIIYYKSSTDGRDAYTHIHGALRKYTKLNSSSAVKAAAADFNNTKYCRVWFNLASPNMAYGSFACVVFIHEYGHMLGRPHNSNIQSPMYNGYITGKVGGPETFDVNKVITFKKSLCGAFHDAL